MSIPSVGLQPLTPAPREELEKFESEWRIGDRTVCFFQNGRRCAFSTEGKEGRRFTFKNPYGGLHSGFWSSARFYSVIAENLEQHEVHSSCFVPRLYRFADHYSPIDNSLLEVALFARLDTRTSPTGDLKWARWGCVHTWPPLKLRQPEYRMLGIGFSDNDPPPHSVAADVTDPVINAFLRHVPTFVREEFVLNDKGEPVVDKQGNPVVKHSSGLVAYLKKFSVSVTSDSTGRIQKVALNHLSIIDRKTHLSENDWAITLVSTQLCSDNPFGRLLKGKIGHAMIACEGVEGGKSFLRYVHLTQSPRQKNPQLKADEAQIELFERDTPLENTSNGPTWVRSKALIENLFRFAEAFQSQPVKFAFSGDLFWGPSKWVETFKLEVLGDVSGFRKRMSVFEERAKIPSTCLDWARELMGTAGVILGRNDCAKRTPLEEIKRINSCKITIVPNGFDSAVLKKPFQKEHHGLRDQFLDSGVVLSPSHCPPEECESWRHQWELEGLMAIHQTITIIKRARLFGVGAALQCIPSNFLDEETGTWKQNPYKHPYAAS